MSELESIRNFQSEKKKLEEAARTTLQKDKRIICSGIVLHLLLCCAQGSENRIPASEPTAAYRRETFHGFTILINPKLNGREHIPPFRKELSKQLKAICSHVPEPALTELRKVHIWVEWNTRKAAAEFHPSRAWLESNGYNQDKAGHIEISNLRHFVQWSRRNQPCMILHEMAHAYQFRVLGDGHAGIREAFRQAVRKKMYESVPYSLGGKRRAYALSNEREYFAELTESYFGENDFYPFTRADLKNHDPVGFALMRRVWGR